MGWFGAVYARHTIKHLSVNLFIVENGLTVWSATLRVFGAGKSDLTVGTPYARQPKY